MICSPFLTCGLTYIVNDTRVTKGGGGVLRDRFGLTKYIFFENSSDREEKKEDVLFVSPQEKEGGGFFFLD